MDIGLDLQRAYDDGYKKGWEEAEAYALHCGDETPMTHADRIRAMTDEELAEYHSEKCGCPHDPIVFGCRMATIGCISCWLDWLKEEIEDE